jgi:hypothetical protein
MLAVRSREAKNLMACSPLAPASSAFFVLNPPPDFSVSCKALLRQVRAIPARFSCPKPSSLPLINRFNIHFSLTSAGVQVYKPLMIAQPSN